MMSEEQLESLRTQYRVRSSTRYRDSLTYHLASG